MDHQAPEPLPKPTDDEFAIHPTVFAANAQGFGRGGVRRRRRHRARNRVAVARLGAHVAVVGRDRAKLDALVAQLASRNLMASAHTADIRDPDAVKVLFDAVWSVHGRVMGFAEIRVNCVAPGAIETEGWKVYTPEARAAYPRSNPMMRAGSPWDIAQACVYLAGTSGGFVTGETVTAVSSGARRGPPESWTIFAER
jgi:NAD(P)-dependent dehydrogenase (short-subunit alcohol dehydrogenase family)